MKTDIYIHKTQDYEIFNTLKGNRELNISHKEKLKKSFKKSDAFDSGKDAKAAATEAFEGLSNL